MKSIFLVLTLAVVGLFASQEHDLARYLRDRYPDPKFIRPVEDHHDVIDLKLAFSLLHINGLEPLSGNLDLHGMLVMTWNDPFLAWDPEEFGGVRKMSFDSSLIWIPNVAAWAEHKDMYKPKLAFIEHTGRVIYLQYARYGVRCTHDHGSEVNDCKLSFGTWSFHKELVTVGMASRPGDDNVQGVSTDRYRETRHWQLQGAEASIQEKAMGPYTYQTLEVTLHVTHKTDGEGQPVGHHGGHGHHGSHEGLESHEEPHGNHHVH